ncbi:bifunctional 2-C-methyl-D-erythritol 4-phosphate cytidylyltransferase/2-C-methyl-D-erythritol 2,4-cyclodiphosphate synthase, partial [Sphingomonas sp. HMWF008]
MNRGKTTAIIVAAGTGTRSGSAVPKQYAPLGGKAVLAHSFAALSAHSGINRVVVVIGAGQEAALRDAVGDVEYVIGGATRRMSVLAGLEALASSTRHPGPVPGATVPHELQPEVANPGGPRHEAGVTEGGHVERVLIHDAARPFL